MPPAAFVRIADANSHPREHAHRKNDISQRSSPHKNARGLASRPRRTLPTLPMTSRPAWPIGGGARKGGNFLVRDSRRAGQVHRQTRRAPSRARARSCGRSFVFDKNEFRRRARPAQILLAASLWRVIRAAARASFNMIPTMEADIKLAIVPRNIARMPSRARSSRLIRRQRADAADLNADGTEIRKAAQRECRDRERPRVERVFHRPEIAGTRRIRSAPCECRADCRSSRSRATARRSPTRRARKPSRKSVPGWMETRLMPCAPEIVDCRPNIPSTR